MHPPSDHSDMQNMRSKLLYLKRWPDFSQAWEMTQVSDVARICALLARKPTVGFLVYRAVDLPSDEVETMLEHLWLSKCIGVFQIGTAPAVPDAPTETAEQSGLGIIAVATPPELVQPAHSAAQASPSRLKKVWGRLLFDPQDRP